MVGRTTRAINQLGLTCHPPIGFSLKHYIRVTGLEYWFFHKWALTTCEPLKYPL